MKSLIQTAAVAVLLVLALTANSYACDIYNQVNGVYYTSCFPWLSTDGYISGYDNLKNDFPRLQRALNAGTGQGKLIFNEVDYFINDTLVLPSWKIIEGTGRGGQFHLPQPSPSPTPTASPTPNGPSVTTSKIIQMASNKSIFKIGAGISEVTIRDIALTAHPSTTGTIGILAEALGTEASSLVFNFSNISFSGFDKGIYVNGKDDPNTIDNPNTTPVENNETGKWQFDNVRLDHASFSGCNTGIHINSFNSGWNMDSLVFFVPPGAAETASSGKTYGVYLERSTYTSMNHLIGNGVAENPGTAFIYVKEHGVLTIQNSIDEWFRNSINIVGSELTNPVVLLNNVFQSDLLVRDTTVVSMGNQFYNDGSIIIHAKAYGASQIYSVGDKFCFASVTCTDATYEFPTDSGTNNSQMISGVDQYKSRLSVPLSIILPQTAGASLLKLGRGAFYYDISRNVNDGWLEFTGNQTSIEGVVDAEQFGYAGYKFKTYWTSINLNWDGSVTYGSRTWAQIQTGTPTTNGTVIYCTNCTKATPCTNGGSGALAKRIANAWDCD